MSAAWGWPIRLPVIAFDKDTDRYAISLIATPVLLCLLSIELFIGKMLAQTVESKKFGDRLPPPFGFGDRTNKFLRVMDTVVLLAFPVISSISLFAKFLSGQFCLKGAPIPGLPADKQPVACGVVGAKLVGTFGTHFSRVSFSASVLHHEYVYQGGPDYAPFWESWGFVLLWLVVAVMLALFFIAVLKESKQPS